jgi:hypothetical protein
MSSGNQTVCPTLKIKSWPPIMPKQREQCLHSRMFLSNILSVSCFLHERNNILFYKRPQLEHIYLRNIIDDFVYVIGMKRL